MVQGRLALVADAVRRHPAAYHCARHDHAAYEACQLPLVALPLPVCPVVRDGGHHLLHLRAPGARCADSPRAGQAPRIQGDGKGVVAPTRALVHAHGQRVASLRGPRSDRTNGICAGGYLPRGRAAAELVVERGRAIATGRTVTRITRSYIAPGEHPVRSAGIRVRASNCPRRSAGYTAGHPALRRGWARGREVCGGGAKYVGNESLL